MPSGPKRISGWGASFVRVLFSASHNSFAAASVATETIRGLHWRTCSAASFTFWPAAMATIWNLVGLVATTSRHWRPMEPVEPRMEIRFICSRGLFYRGLGRNANFGFALCVVEDVRGFYTEATEERRRKIGERQRLLPQRQGLP